MSQHFSCPQGHQWEQEQTVDLHATCPVCGSHADARTAQEVEKTAPLEALDKLPPPPQSLATAGPPTWPAKIGRYEVLEEIARGGMGAVLRVRDPELERTLAIKLILPSVRQLSRAQKRFLNEAKITGQLQHPGIPPIHELVELENGRSFFSMKLIEGRTLANLLDDRPKPSHDLPRFLSIFEHICQTLAFAHSRQVIHRDLKPANIMVGAFGEVQVMDWGLAKKLRRGGDEEFGSFSGELAANNSMSEPSLTQTGEMMGTPAFIAPEQARAEIAEVDERSDVFGLGGILCQILTGTPTFSGKASEDLLKLAMAADVAGAFQRLDACGADDALVELAKQCLAPNKADRPYHAGAVAGAIEDYRANVRQRLRQAELDRTAAEARAAEEHKRRRLTLALSAVLLVLVVGAGGAIWWYQQYRSAYANRKAAIEHGIGSALASLRSTQGDLHGQLAKPEGLLALLDNPSRWKGILQKERAELKRAKELRDSFDGEIAHDLQTEIKAYEAQVAHDQSDFSLALKIEKVRLDRAAIGTRHVTSAVASTQKAARDACTVSEFNGTLSKSRPEAKHELKMLAGKTYIVKQQSRDFDPVLRLEDDSGKFVTQNDDFMGRKLASQFRFSPQRDGTFHIVASSQQRRGVGRYKLTVLTYPRKK